MNKGLTKYCPYDDKCNELYDCTKEEYETMKQANMKLSLEYQQLKEIEKEHQRINGELRVENKELKDRIDKAIECTNQMIFKGYTDGMAYYFATSEKSEFGVRAKIILEKLKGDKE